MSAPRRTARLPADVSAIAAAARVLRGGGLVAFPTETVYGLGALALDEAAVASVFAAKGRPSSDPLIVHLADAADLAGVASDLPPLALSLAARLWPGPLTLVLPRHPYIPAAVSAGQQTVAVRVPDHPVARALIAAAGPLVAPSANRFGRPSPTSAAHVLLDLDGRIDMVLDAGQTRVGVESTVLDLTSDPPRVLRPGGIAIELLRTLVPDLAYAPRYLAEADAAPAPGMLLRHYAPLAAMTLYDGPAERALPAIRSAAAARLARGERIGLLLPSAELAQLRDIPATYVDLGGDATVAATRLFDLLRQLDTADVAGILARGFPRDGIGLALWDRMVRAAEGRVVPGADH